MSGDELQHAIDLAKAGRKAEARDIATRLVRHNRDNLGAWVVLAQVVGDRQQAIDCLQQVLRLEPSHPWATLHLARLMGQPAPPPEPSLSPLTQPAPPAPTPPPPAEPPHRGWTDELKVDVPPGDLDLGNLGGSASVAAGSAETDLDPLSGTATWKRPPSTPDAMSFDSLREEVRKKPAPRRSGCRRWLVLAVAAFLLVVLVVVGLVVVQTLGLLPF